MAYKGYLAPYLDAMKKARAAGMSTTKIAKMLGNAGIRSPYNGGWDAPSVALVRFALGLTPKKYKRVITRGRWQSWTPKKQFIEFEGELL